MPTYLDQLHLRVGLEAKAASTSGTCDADFLPLPSGIASDRNTGARVSIVKDAVEHVQSSARFDAHHVAAGSRSGGNSRATNCYPFHPTSATLPDDFAAQLQDYVRWLVLVSNEPNGFVNYEVGFVNKVVSVSQLFGKV